MEPTSTVSSPVDAPARLSYAQKRDLLGQAVAAVVTTALIAAPLISPSPDTAGELPLAALPAQSFAAPVAAVAVADATGFPLRHDRTLATGRSALRDTRVESTVTTAPSGSGLANAGYTAAAPRAARELPRKPLSRRLTGWLTGNGTHVVRPFPSLPAGRS